MLQVRFTQESCFGNLKELTTQHDKVVIAAPGPSLTQEQIDMVRDSGVHCITIGDVGRVMYPDAPVLYHCDNKWWKHYDYCPDFKGLRVSLEDVDDMRVVEMERSELTEGLDLRYPYLVTGCHSGYQAINLAMFSQPKEIILIGYDQKDTRDGRHNIIGHHPHGVRRQYDFNLFISTLTSLLPVLDNLGVNVYNCTIDSALKCFPRKDLIDVL